MYIVFCYTDAQILNPFFALQFSIPAQEKKYFNSVFAVTTFYIIRQKNTFNKTLTFCSSTLFTTKYIQSRSQKERGNVSPKKQLKNYTIAKHYQNFVHN